MSQNGQTYFKSLTANAARFLKCVFRTLCIKRLIKSYSLPCVQFKEFQVGDDVLIYTKYYVLVLFSFSLLIGILSMEGWTATTRHGVNLKRLF